MSFYVAGKAKAGGGGRRATTTASGHRERERADISDEQKQEIREAFDLFVGALSQEEIALD
jgi:hypothetical protein